MSDISGVKNFNYKEFGCKCGKCLFTAGIDIFEKLPILAQEIRNELKRPLKVTSGCRCFLHNQKVGGSEFSQHLRENGFRAMDLDIKSSQERHIAMAIAIKHGASIGIHKDFMHFDFRENARIIFLY